MTFKLSLATFIFSFAAIQFIFYIVEGIKQLISILLS